MIDIIIFSKDRAMQLDLLLRSIKDNFKEAINITILYKWSNNDFQKGYYFFMGKDYGIPIAWIKETNFYGDTKRIINNFTYKNCVCFVDDEVIIRKPDFNKIVNNGDKEISGFNLRLGDSFKYSWNADSRHELPFFERKDNVIKWNWINAKKNSDYNYPYCINSIIRETEYFKNIVNSINFSAPNNFEMAITKYNMSDKPFMVAFDKPISINIANNVSQTAFKSRSSEDKNYSLEELNNKFLNGEIISTDNLYDRDFECPTMPVNYFFKKA